MEVTLETAIDELLRKFDPLEKARRRESRGKIFSRAKPEKKSGIAPFSRKVLKRKALSTSTKHQVYLKSQGQCEFVHSDGKRCLSERHLEVHHVLPVSEGGGDSIQNLKLLCSGHHKVFHSNEF